MTINHNKHIITIEIVWIRQLFVSRVTFLSLSEVSVVFNISASHANTYLPNRYFLHEQILISKYSSILHALWDSQSYVLGFHIYSLQEPQSSNSLHSHQHSPWFRFCFKLHTLSFNPHLHSHDSCWTENLVSFTPRHEIKDFYIHSFYFIRNTYSSIWIIDSITTSTTFINTDRKRIIKRLIRVYVD